MNDALMQALLAGWISGAVAGLSVTGVVLLAAARRPWLAARLPLQKRLGILGIVVANAMVLVLTLAGLVLGALYHRTHGGGQFSLWVLCGVVVIGGLYAFVRGRIRTAEAPVVLSGLVTVALSFGVVLPWLASIDQ